MYNNSLNLPFDYKELSIPLLISSENADTFLEKYIQKRRIDIAIQLQKISVD